MKKKRQKIPDKRGVIREAAKKLSFQWPGHKEGEGRGGPLRKITFLKTYF